MNITNVNLFSGQADVDIEFVYKITDKENNRDILSILET